MFNKNHKGSFPNLKHLLLNWEHEEPITQNKTESIRFPSSLTELGIFWVDFKEHNLDILSGLNNLVRLRLHNTTSENYTPILNADIIGSLQNLKVNIFSIPNPIFFISFFEKILSLTGFQRCIKAFSKGTISKLKKLYFAKLGKIKIK